MWFVGTSSFIFKVVITKDLDISRDVSSFEGFKIFWVKFIWINVELKRKFVILFTDFSVFGKDCVVMGVVFERSRRPNNKSLEHLNPKRTLCYKSLSERLKIK